MTKRGHQKGCQENRPPDIKTAFVGEIKSGDEGWPSRYKSKTKYIIVTYLGE